MTTTDELRKLLDERGVEYEKGCYVLDATRRRAIETAWVNNDCRYEFTEYPLGSTRLDIYNITPEQAIAATLGSGTCKPTEEGYCPICGEDLVKCNVGIGEHGGAVELDPPIYHNYCPNCGAKVVER